MSRKDFSILQWVLVLLIVCSAISAAYADAFARLIAASLGNRGSDLILHLLRLLPFVFTALFLVRAYRYRNDALDETSSETQGRAMNSGKQGKNDSQNSGVSTFWRRFGAASFALDATGLAWFEFDSSSKLGHGILMAGGVCTSILIFLAIANAAENSQSILKAIQEDWECLNAIKGPVEETFRLVQQKATVQSIRPHEINDFTIAFSGAMKVQAYNPPLTLLTRTTDHQFRDVIFELFVRGGRYDAIVGDEGVKSLVDLHDLWVKERGVQEVRKQTARMNVITYTHSQKLHTPIPDWPVLNKDLRGLSFFLVEAPGIRKTLLYILGEPFTPEFDVPQIALLITEPESVSPIFTMVHDTFSTRWRKLESNGHAPQVSTSQTLPGFCKSLAPAEKPKPGTPVKQTTAGPFAPEVGQA